MIINLLGDSITEGCCASSYEKCYAALLETKSKNIQVNNYGICGTRVARQKVSFKEERFDLDFVLRAPNMEKDADLVVVFGGTNDFGHGDAPLGNIDDQSVYSFYGALNCLLDYLIKTYGKEKVRYILPLHRHDENNDYGELYAGVNGKASKAPRLSEYTDAIINVCNAKNIKIWDFREVFPSPNVGNGNDYFFDGLHPNDIGYNLLADIILNQLEKEGYDVI